MCKIIYSSIKILALTLLVVVGLMLPADVYACSCLPPGSVQEEAIDADAVFAGQVTQIDPGVEKDEVKVTLNITELFKGGEETVVVGTMKYSDACGYEFRKGKSYLVYALRSGNNLGTSLCSRTRALSQAEEDLTVLRQLPPSAIKKINVVFPPHGPTVFPFPWSALLVALLWVVVILSVAVIVGLLITRLLKFRKQTSLKSRKGR